MIQEYREQVAAIHGAAMARGAEQPTTDRAEQREAVWRFVCSAIHGDVPAFLANLPALTWPGAWRDVFAEIVQIGWVHPDIREAFFRAWRGWDDWHTNPPLGINWLMGKDLDSQDQLFANAMRILLPALRPTSGIPALFRGQGLAEHHQGRHGAWWTPCPIYAEWFARSKIRAEAGPGVVLVALDPGEAVIAQLNKLEFILDPVELSVRQVAAVPRYSADEELQPDLCTKLMGVPVGHDAEGVAAWVSLGMPLPGLTCWADHRLAQLAAQLRMGAAA